MIVLKYFFTDLATSIFSGAPTKNDDCYHHKNYTQYIYINIYRIVYIIVFKTY